MEIRIAPPSTYGEHIYTYGPETSGQKGWPFELHPKDEASFLQHAQEGLRNLKLAILGPPQYSSSENAGVRNLVPIAELAQSLKLMRSHGVDIVNRPAIFCPIRINSWANEIPLQDNEKMALFYHTLATHYFEAFHPDLPLPELTTDQSQGVEVLAEIGPSFAEAMEKESKLKLVQMALHHTNGHHSQLRIEARAASYLGAHFVVYGLWNLPQYADLADTLFIVPRKETEFHHIMEQVSPQAPFPHKEFDQTSGNPLIGYSSICRTAPYYKHAGEPSLPSCANQWPTNNMLSHAGMNGFTQKEVVTSIRFIEKDITGGNPAHRPASIRTLQTIIRESLQVLK